MAALAHILVGDLEDTGLSFPTSALAVIGVRRGWNRVAPGSGSLDAYWTPKGGPVVLRD